MAKKVGFHGLTDKILGANHEEATQGRRQNRADNYKTMGAYAERVGKTFINVLRARYPKDSDGEIAKKMATRKCEDFVVGLVKKKDFGTSDGEIRGAYRNILVRFATEYETKRVIEEGNFEDNKQLCDVFSMDKAKKSQEISSILYAVVNTLHEFYNTTPNRISGSLRRTIYSIITKVVNEESVRHRTTRGTNENHSDCGDR